MSTRTNSDDDYNGIINGAQIKKTLLADKPPSQLYKRTIILTAVSFHSVVFSIKYNSDTQLVPYLVLLT